LKENGREQELTGN